MRVVLRVSRLSRLPDGCRPRRKGYVETARRRRQRGSYLEFLKSHLPVSLSLSLSLSLSVSPLFISAPTLSRKDSSREISFVISGVSYDLQPRYFFSLLASFLTDVVSCVSKEATRREIAAQGRIDRRGTKKWRCLITSK